VSHKRGKVQTGEQREEVCHLKLQYQESTFGTLGKQRFISV